MVFVNHQSLGERFAHAMNALDRQALAALLTDDYVTEWPQSRERIRGFDKFYGMITSYPGATEGSDSNDTSTVRAHPQDAIKLVAPSFTLVKVDGGGDAGVFTLRVRYPDGSQWWVINIYRLREGRIASAVGYFAPEYPAPEWRSRWTEPM